MTMRREVCKEKMLSTQIATEEVIRLQNDRYS